LIITKEKRQQTDLLDPSDFEAVCLTMKSLDDSFAFYNAGEKAGSSQPHKHIQVIPLKNVPGNQIPIDERVRDAMNRAEH
jgi:sulfate adenylyltransferase (ADP) / ATP adenylyltransferase